MRLTDLKPCFIQYKIERVDPALFIDGILSPSGLRISFPHVELLADAHGIEFLCPLCINTDQHSVICWFEDKVPEDAKPGPGRWNPTGTDFNDLSFVPGRRTHSVLLLGGCRWHGFITNGEVIT